MIRPHPQEYPSYFRRYISLVPDGVILDILADQAEQSLAMLNNFSEEVGTYRYAPEKWSIKQVIGHIMDTERVFNYRALCFARDDQTRLPSFDQDLFSAAANYHDRSLLNIIDEYSVVRDHTIALFRSFDDRTWQKTGTASDYQLSIRSIAFIIAGHEIHHHNIIKDRYLNIKQ